MRCARFAGLAILALALLVTPLAAEAQSPGKVYRVGFVTVVSPERAAVFVNAMRQGLHELGYADGQIVIDVRAAGGRPDRLSEFVAEWSISSRTFF